MRNGEGANTPLPERQTASWGVQIGAVILCATAFGYLESDFPGWSAWSYYVLELLLSFSVRYGLGKGFEKPDRYLGPWRSLYWRVLVYESLVWSWNLVFFLSVLDASKHKDGLLWLVLAGIIGFSMVALSKKLVSKFRCPHCHEFFFNEKGIKDGDGLYPFSLSKWPNTLCQHCEWPLGKL